MVSRSRSTSALLVIAGNNGEERLISNVDARIADDEAPGLIVTQSANSTNVIESSDLVVLGEGFVNKVLTGRKYLAITSPAKNAPAGTYSITVSTPLGAVLATASVAASGTASMDSIAAQLATILNDDLDVTAQYDITSDGGIYSAVFNIGAENGAQIIVAYDTLPSGVTAKFVTRFTGDFGVAVLREVGIHDSIYTAQNIDLARWSAASNSDIVSYMASGTPKWHPHLTILGTGDGNTDFYRFSITDAMLRAQNGPITVTFDIDHGFDYSDPVFWRSVIKVYDQDGRLIGQGSGFSDPLDFAQSGTGSSTYYDDFLTYTFSQKGTYYIEVDNGFGFGGLPTGVDYTLHVSIPQHAVSGFVFAPEALSEDEDNNDGVTSTTAQNVDAKANFFTFFDPNIGNVIFGGGINSETPYVRIQGSGDGTYDVYSFVVTNQMLNPNSVESITPAGGDGKTYYKEVVFKLSGQIHTGDVWTLPDVRYRSYTHTVVDGDTLQSIAQALLDQLPSRFFIPRDNGNGTFSTTNTTADGTITLIDEAGFTFGGLTQLIPRAGTVTRSTTPKDSANADVTFSEADITLSNIINTAETDAVNATPGDIWCVTVTDAKTNTSVTRSHPVPTTGETLAQVATALATAIGSSFGATPNGAGIHLSKVDGFRLSVSVAGENTRGYMSIAGRPLLKYTAVTLSLGAGTNTNAADGDAWTVALDGIDYTVDVTDSVTPLDTGVAESLKTHAVTAGYTVTRSGTSLTISRATAFTLTSSVTSSVSASAITVSGGTTYQPQFTTAQWDSADYILAGPVREGDRWTLTLNSESFFRVVRSTDNAQAVANNIRDSINNDPDNHFTATVLGSNAAGWRIHVTPNDTASKGFTSSFSILSEGRGITVTGTLESAVFTFNGTPHLGEKWRIKQGTTELYAHDVTNPGGVIETTATVIDALVNSINSNTADVYVARAEEGNKLVLTRVDGSALPTPLTGEVVPAGSFSSIDATGNNSSALEFSGTPHIGEIWRITVGTLPAIDYAITSTSLETAARGVAAAVDALTGYVAVANPSPQTTGNWRVSFVRISANMPTVTVDVLPGTTDSPSSLATHTVTLTRTPAVGEVWRIDFPSNIFASVTVLDTDAGTPVVPETLDALAIRLAAQVDALAGYVAPPPVAGVITITSANGTDTFTADLSVNGAVASAAPTADPAFAIVNLGVNANEGDTWSFGLPLSPSGTLTASATVGINGFLDLLNGFVADIDSDASYTAGYENSVTSHTLVITRQGATFLLTNSALTVTSPDTITGGTKTGTVIGRSLDSNGATVAGNGTPNVGDTWSLTFAGATYSTIVVTADTNATVATRLADLANTGSGAEHAVVNEGGVIYLSTFGSASTAAGDGNVAVTLAPVHGGFIVDGVAKAAQKQTVELFQTDGIAVGDIWRLYIKNASGVSTLYDFPASSADYGNVTDGLAGKLPTATYDAATNTTDDFILDVSRDDGAPVRFGNGNTVFDSALSHTRPNAYTGRTNVDDTRTHYLPSSTIKLANDPDAGGFRSGDVWRLFLDNQYYEYEVPSGLDRPRTLSTVAAGLVAALRGAVSVRTVTGGSSVANEVQEIYLNVPPAPAVQGTFKLTFREGSSATANTLTTADIAWGATAADVALALNDLTLSTGDKLNVSVTGSGTQADPWRVTFLNPGSFNVPVLTGAVKFDGTDADLLADDVGNPAYDVTYTTGEVQFTVTDRDSTAGNQDPFIFDVKRGGKVHVVLDIDKSNLLYDYLYIFGYTASVAVELVNGSGTVLAKDHYGLSSHQNIADPGSETSRDAFLEYDITQISGTSETFYVRVSSYIDFDEFGFYGIPSYYYFPDGLAGGVVPGQSYELNMSIQGHQTNESAIGLVGKTLAIVGGTGVGQTALILGYDAEAKEYTLDRAWTTTPDNTSKFEISYHLSEEFPGTYATKAQVTDSYSVTLTKNPGALVYLRAVPSLTRTYNSNLAFDSSQNNGRNETVQVRTATQQATIELRGVVTDGEIWTLKLTEADTSTPTNAAKKPQPFSYAAASGDTLEHIASELSAKVDATALFVATANGATITITSKRAPFFTQVLLSRGGADITPTYTSGALTSAGVKLIGTPTVRYPVSEVWKLTLNGEDLNYHVNVGDTLADIAAGLVAAFKRDGLTGTPTAERFDGFTVAVDGADNTKLNITSSAAFTLAFTVTGDRNGALLTGTRDTTGAFNNLNVALTGHPNGGAATPEVWKLRLGSADLKYTAQVNDTLSTVANGLLAEFNRQGLGTLYTFLVTTSSIEVARIGGASFAASFIVTPNYETQSIVTPSVIFAPDSWDGAATITRGSGTPATPATDGAIYYDETNKVSYLGAGTEWVTLTNWNVSQEVYVEAIDDNFVDGSDALVFPSPEQRVNGIRGPLTINGGIGVAEDAFLNDPFRLPGETNFPLPDGRVYGPVAAGSVGRITDTYSIHTLPEYGERLGFDPRTNLSLYNVTLLDGGAEGSFLDLLGTNSNILTVAFKNAFAASATLSGSGNVTFTGVPLASEVGSIQWRSVMVSLSGVASRNEKWNVSLDGTNYTVRSVTLSAADVANLNGAISKLSGAPSTGTSPLTYLWSLFTAGEKANLLDGATSAAAKLSILLRVLNGAITDSTALNVHANFQNVVLSSDTINLITQNPTGEALLRLNRLLINDALTGAIAPDTSTLLEMVDKLRAQLPVVGDVPVYTVDFFASVFGNRLIVTRNGVPFTFDFSVDATSTIRATVRGTPDTMPVGAIWTQAAWVFTGDIRAGDTAAISFAGMTFNAAVPSGATADARVAGLTALLKNAMMLDTVGVPVGIPSITQGTLASAFQPGITGDTILFRNNVEVATPFEISASANLTLVTTPDRPASGKAARAELKVAVSSISVNDIFTVTLNSTPFSYAAKRGDRAADVLLGLRDVIARSAIGATFLPAIVDGALTIKSLQIGDSYFYAPVNLNTRVTESEQVDILNVFNADSPADDNGTLTESTVTGLGMGGGAVVGGRAFDGGITYGNLEVVNILLGTGNDHFTVESTHRGLTFITTQIGADVVDVKTIMGHTIIQTGDGVDVINLRSNDLVLDQLSGNLVLDGGDGRDVLNVHDNSGLGILTTSQPGVLDVDDARTVFIRAAGGHYILRSTGFGQALTDSVGVTRFAGYAEAALDFSMGQAQLQQALRTLFASNNIIVSEVRGVGVTTFAVSLTATGTPRLAWTIVCKIRLFRSATLARLLPPASPGSTCSRCPKCRSSPFRRRAVNMFSACLATEWKRRLPRLPM